MVSQKLSVICIDGRESDYDLELSERAARRSAELLGCDYAFASPKSEGYKIPALCNHIEYSALVMRRSSSFSSADFLLYVQSDGFVLDASKFEEAFFDYDYIGAPWPTEWPNSRVNRVGNGGFSLRSRSLMDFVATLPLDCLKIKDGSGHFPYVEDTAICVFYKSFLESKGFKFAPVELAARFSFENYTEFPSLGSFGFHGKANELTQSYCRLL